MQEQFGIPVVSADDVFDVLEEFGIRQWPHQRPPMDLDEFLAQDLTKEERDDLRFAPKAEVVFLEEPNGRLFRGFRSKMRNAATVFTLLPGDLVLLVGEWKHGTEIISLVTPTGNPSQGETLMDAGRREFEAEVGIKLSEIIPLSTKPISSSCRQTTETFIPFLGVVEKPVTRGPSSLDETEYIQAVLMPLQEWMELIDRGLVQDAYAVVVTHLALRKLGRLEFTS